MIKLNIRDSVDPRIFWDGSYNNSYLNVNSNQGTALNGKGPCN